nr:cupin domain-containing protein [Azospirillum aestuarii]
MVDHGLRWRWTGGPIFPASSKRGSHPEIPPFVEIGGNATPMAPHTAPGSSFQVNIHHVAVGGRSDGCITHPGEEFVYVLAGEIDLILGDEVTRMCAGDSAFFASEVPHGYSNPGGIPAAVLWLNSPPTF